MENYTFYPGQKVVCVNALGHRYGTCLDEGKTYTVSAVRSGCCGIELDVGLPAMTMKLHCPSCNRFEMTTVRWRGAFRFRPIDTLTEQVERIEKEGAPLELETA